MSKEKERLCIRVDKVYDWVTREIHKDFCFEGVEGLAKLGFTKGPHCDKDHNKYPGIDPCQFFGPDATLEVKCFPTDAAGNKIDVDDIKVAQVGERQDVFVEEVDTTLQLVRLKTTGYFVVQVTGIDCGKVLGTLTSQPISFCIIDKYLLCAPEGTEINAHVYYFECEGTLSCEDGEFEQLALTLLLCQSVQVEAEVKVEVEGRICKPREEIIAPISVCPDITFPPQCPEIFPPSHKC
ncbi:hypothetical protein AWH56_015835 [Anaerobacillus isosaccharinicus]|uniref:Uncharacterized protein n=1 Tax=Anaerobacillus isosaccharinicus TaxID=1532552 RepID=A0A1S2KV95_9BACI|nr:hypothetical protein [Anaerobacillus isosaccharinicus]MBA5587628.1 hypothetical protein [Anaerobacillus isosaccharinicus]QOY34196.1 hypothetical protein AWH56_015835 [Anaerobacillus isosaccharinicus]